MRFYKISNNSDFDAVCKLINPHNAGKKIMRKKANLNFIIIKNASHAAINILKQDALSVGAELVSHKDTILGGSEKTTALLIANAKQTELLAKKEKLQDFGLKKLGEFLDLEFQKPQNCQIMGVLNITDNSFYEKSRVSQSELIARALKIIEDGASWLDIGAASTRPNSEYIGAKAEFQAVKKAVDLLYTNKIHQKVALSIDTFDENCAKYALDHGFALINDISSSPKLAALSAKYGAKYCFMHGGIKGSSDKLDGDIMEIMDSFFENKILEFQSLGLKKQDMILDIGIGFGKSHEQCLTLLKNLEQFLRFDCPLLVGASRKSVINAYFASSAENRLAGSLFLHQKAVENGASIIRTHDTYEHAQLLALFAAYKAL